MTGKIVVRKAIEHNLKALDLEIPYYGLTVVTGVSGSGKSSLVSDTLYREAERRYLESFSSYARRFLGKLDRPAVGHISGLRPAIAIDQKAQAAVRSPRSTVGTMTELYDHLRLLFARLGGNKTAARRLFSFNSPLGACPACSGLGVQDRIDPLLLIDDQAKTLREGALTITTPSGYIIYSQVTMEVLDKVCRAHGFHVDIPWQDLDDRQKDIVLNGSQRIKIPYGKHPLESRLRWSGITARPREEGYYKGILPVMENILRVSRNKNILRFARSMTCAACGGARLKPEALAVTFRGKNIAQMAALSIDQLDSFFRETAFTPDESPVGEPLRQAFLQRTALLSKLGLGHLSLDRESTTLSGGEAQRIHLASQVGSPLRGILYILDEPSIGLHHRDNRRLLDVLDKLRADGGTVLVVEHEEEIIRAADRIIDIGPAAGTLGGELLFNGPIHELLEKTPEDHPLRRSRTHRFLTGLDAIPVPGTRRSGSGSLTVLGARQHNLKNIDVSFRLGALNVVTGVSGAGKSTLVHHILGNSLRKQLHNAQTQPGEHREIQGAGSLNKVIDIDQTPIGRTPRSNPATYVKLFDHVRDLFAAQEEAKKHKWGKGRFSFNVKGGRCDTCEGAGVQQIGMHFLGDVEAICPQCSGKRFNDETLRVKYNGKSIYDVLEMTVDEAAGFFSDHAVISRYLTTFQQLGLGYIGLGQPATTLSGGEAQRIKLASELCRPATGKTLYILDEPTTGLHAADITILLDSLNRLAEKGNTVIVVEHHPDFIKTADWVVDLGPESGNNGGDLVAAGTPEQVAEVRDSHTGAFLRQLLSGQEALAPVPRPTHDIPGDEPIRLKGVSTHNLKHIDVEIPVNRLTVITGVSGSGKSSLAFDTIFAEGRQRFLSRFSTYVRRLLPNRSTGEMESCSGLTPTIAISRGASARNPRSTVGTMTEIYDYYRLLFARVGKKDGQYASMAASMFSFNHHQGACPRCKGLAAVTTCDPLKLVTHPNLSLLQGAMDGSKTGRFYGDPFGQHTAILARVGEIHNIDFSVPWESLDEPARRIAMYGTGEQSYDVIWKFKRKTREGEHNFQTQWQGLVNYVNEEYQRKHDDKRGQAMLPLMTDQTCPQCNGQRLNDDVLSVHFAGVSIAQLCAKSVEQSIAFFQELNAAVPERDIRIIADIRSHVLERLGFIQNLGLGYLSLDRASSTLSGGEAQRIRLAGQLGSGLSGITYVLDEPTIGLHSRDTQKLLEVLHELRDRGNTVIVVEHDADVIRAADHIIDIGPGSGTHGGHIVAEGNTAQVQAVAESRTGQYLRNPDAIPTPQKPRSLNDGLKITGAFAHNLKNFDLDIPSAGLIVITGVSGSGKSTLLFDVIGASAHRRAPVGCRTIDGFQNFNKLVKIDQDSIGTSPASNPATYTGLFDRIRDLFAKTDLAKTRGYKKNRFSFNIKGGRCETCQGMGEIRTSMDFLADVWTTCEDCHGKRYNAETLQCLHKGKSIADVLEMTVKESSAFFNGIPAILKPLSLMDEVGLGYLKLGQPANTLSGGEAQRLKLVTQLITGKGINNLYLMDEPTTGLHFDDVARLLSLFHRLADAGHTLLVIEHHPDIIKNADYTIELGPQGGDQGGFII